MSVKSGTGLICVKEECKGTEFTCACDICESFQVPKLKVKDSFMLFLADEKAKDNQ